MKNLRQIARYLLVACGVICLGLYPFLPSDIPMQYNLSGGVNYTFPKFLALITVFALNAIFVLYVEFKTKDEEYPRKHIVTQMTLMIVTLMMMIKNLF